MSEAIRPTMMAMSKILGRPKPAIERIPKTASTHRTRSTPAICRNGDGRMLIAPTTNKSTKTFHSVTSTPLIVKKRMSGKVIPLMLT